MTPHDIAAQVAREQKRHLDDQRIDETELFIAILATFAAIGLLAVVAMLVMLARAIMR